MDEDNVRPFPPRAPEPEPSPGASLLIGPFQEWRVVVDGRVLPHITGFREDGKIWLVVDNRFACGPFDPEQARQAALLAGQAMTVVAGYPSLSAPSRDMPFAPEGVFVSEPPAA